MFWGNCFESRHEPSHVPESTCATQGQIFLYGPLHVVLGKEIPTGMLDLKYLQLHFLFFDPNQAQRRRVELLPKTLHACSLHLYHVI